ncbi:hypothetical protein EDD17DRAFT_553904 [Pisolithus thermaeus]|nr:hypothetical protein EDD17DRAFT_553904 [Pisolithus thermaeus]
MSAPAGRWRAPFRVQSSGRHTLCMSPAWQRDLYGSSLLWMYPVTGWGSKAICSVTRLLVVITIVPCGVRRSATDTLRGHSNVGVFVICCRARTRATALRISRGRPFLFGAMRRVHAGGYVLFDPSKSKRRYGYVSPTVLARGTSTQDTWWVVFESHFPVGCFATPSLLSPALQEGASTITQHAGSAAP